MTSFSYRAFRWDGEPGLALQVTNRMLPAQGHLLPVLAAIERCMRSGEPTGSFLLANYPAPARCSASPGDKCGYWYA